MTIPNASNGVPEEEINAFLGRRMMRLLRIGRIGRGQFGTGDNKRRVIACRGCGTALRRKEKRKVKRKVWLGQAVSGIWLLVQIRSACKKFHRDD